MHAETVSRRAIVVGAAGQDGSLLFDLLKERGYALVGVERGRVRTHKLDWRRTVDLGNLGEVSELVRAVSPDEVYYLAAFHHSAEDVPIEPQRLFFESNTANVTGLFHYLESVRLHAPAARTFYASSSHVFGAPETPVQDELTPLKPNSIYAMTKAYGMALCRHYRGTFGLHVSVGILFNHESPLRGPQFLSKKIVQSVSKIRRGEMERLVIGNLSARADWGYAPEYVDAMTRMVALPESDDFVVATGKDHSVEDFVAAAFAQCGLDWRQFTSEEPGVLVRRNLPLIGNPSKLHRATGWQARTDFVQMVKRLVEGEKGK